MNGLKDKINAGWGKLSTGVKALVLVGIATALVGAGILVGLITDKRTLRPASPTATTVAVRPSPLPTQPYVRPDFNYGLVPISLASTPNPKDPAILLQTANTALHNGKLTDAISQFREIITVNPDSKEAALALYGLGQALSEAGRWQDAADTYQKFLTQYPTHADRRLAYFGLGVARKALGQHQPAITAFQQYQKETTILDGYANFEIADSYNTLGNQDQALLYYQKVAQDIGTSSNLLRAQALERMGDIYSAKGSFAEATGWYNRILEFAKVWDYRAGIFMKIARAHLRAGQTEQAYNVYNVVADQYRDTPSGIPAIQALLNANPNTVDDFLKGYIALNQGDFTQAQTFFNKYIGRNSPDEPVPTPAATLTKEQKERLARARYYVGLTWERLKETDKAVAEYKELQKWLPGTVAAEEGLWKAGSVLRTANKGAEAAAIFADMIKAYPNGAYTERAAFAQLQVALLQNNLSEATVLTESFAQKWAISYRRDEAYYRLGKAYEAANNSTAAKAAYQKAADSTIDGYYSARAFDVVNKLDSNNPVPASATTHPSVFDPVKFNSSAVADRTALEQWLLSWANPVTTTATPNPQASLERARTTIWEDPAVQRMLELRRLGWVNQAEREAKEANDRYINKPLELYYLSIIFSEQSDYYYSIEAARYLFGLYQQKKPDAGLKATPILLQKLIYPLAFNDVVLEFTQLYKYDPLLQLSLMKQESVFDPTAISSAEARGLTQVIPDTAKAIAAVLGKKDFRLDDLLLPYTSLEFGTYYFSQRLKDYKGNPFKALGAYNAGAGNMNRWVDESPPERNFDDFVENIDFPETRDYIKIIFSNYFEYRRIYKL